jgi:predicted nucleic acid-binding protein
LTLYLDTSVLVCALTNDSETANIQAWLAAPEADDRVISDWVATEFSSAMSIKLRTGQIGLRHRNAALAMFTQLVTESFRILRVDAMQFRTAARFADQFALGMRAGDALHLAICAHHGATLCKLDRRLAEAGPALGVTTWMP